VDHGVVAAGEGDVDVATGELVGYCGW
jgi:hypothetical protein